MWYQETYIETQTEYLPELLRTVTTALCTSCDNVTDTEMTKSLKLCSKILTRVLPSMTPVGGSDVESSRQNSPFKRIGMIHSEAEEIMATDGGLQSGSDVFVSADSDNGEDVKPPVQPRSWRELSPQRVPTVSRDQGKEETENCGDQLKVPGVSGDSQMETSVETANKEETDSFQDFVQYEEFVHFKISPGRKPDVSRQDSADVGPATLMQACVQSFQTLFHTYVSASIIKDKDIVSVLLQQLMKNKNSDMRFPPQLENLDMRSGANDRCVEENISVRRIVLGELPRAVCEAFLSACQLLVDFSSFPMYCTNYHKVLQNSFRAGRKLCFLRKCS